MNYKRITLIILYFFGYSCNTSDDDFFDGLILKDSDSTKFYFYNDNDTTLVGKQGTKIDIEANTFKTDKPVSIELKEFFNIPEMLLEGLSTMSTQGLLETDGMIDINCSNIPNKKIFISVPKQTTSKKMQLYYNIGDSNEVLWKLSEYPNPKERYITSLVGGERINYLIDDTINDRVFSTLNLGLLNVDKLVSFNKKIDLNVDIDGSYNKGVIYSLLFYNFNSIVRGGINEKREVVFKNVPSFEKATIIALASKKDDLYYSFLDINIEKDRYTLPPLKKVKINTLTLLLENKFGNKLSKK